MSCASSGAELLAAYRTGRSGRRLSRWVSSRGEVTRLQSSKARVRRVSCCGAAVYEFGCITLPTLLAGPSRLSRLTCFQ